jgi:hypothetical protein
MKKGDLVKVKNICAYGNVYIQQIAGSIAVLLTGKEVDDRMKIMTQGKPWYVCYSDVEVI